MDPARVAAETRRVAARVAADQVAAQAERTARGRTVGVRPGEDGLTDWYALLPTATSAAAWSAVTTLADEYRQLDDSLTQAEARADAFGDLLLRNVRVSAQVTLGVPVVTGAAAPEPVATESVHVQWDDDETVVDCVTGQETRFADLAPESREALSWRELTVEDVGGFATTMAPVAAGFAVSGTQLAGLGWVDAGTVAGLLRTLPLDVARAVLDAETGTLAAHTTSAYRPPKGMREFVTARDGTCRMWGCARPAESCDLDHTRPWPTGATTPANLVALCRRHHRMKQPRPLALPRRRHRHCHLGQPVRHHPNHRAGASRPADPRRRGDPTLLTGGWGRATARSTRIACVGHAQGSAEAA